MEHCDPAQDRRTTEGTVKDAGTFSSFIKKLNKRSSVHQAPHHGKDERKQGCCQRSRTRSKATNEARFKTDSKNEQIAKASHQGPRQQHASL